VFTLLLVSACFYFTSLCTKSAFGDAFSDCEKALSKLQETLSTLKPPALPKEIAQAYVQVGLKAMRNDSLPLGQKYLSKAQAVMNMPDASLVSESELSFSSRGLTLARTCSSVWPCSTSRSTPREKPEIPSTTSMLSLLSHTICSSRDAKTMR